ncbi:rod shape-determining protein MreD [Companilactobacillus sp.]|jgi:rod shape-determining protein MreD|uniref:rod shape-determining protein MreD n=1 Tax=Companilactobacillus sp. TaxID=2767905 RepID=UPI0025C66243|nr:rod shape-determining protein MreD [Companilactobacillus sp.]MCH4008456.1 rod shape-determining protein MreD [Companilactobacillus sp.]MCH4051365.1 rod shape-determining protein MreD [Companilactobacillus sp.]MCH4076399.1 rod shape-determining protein MreD [Companilactobacillus sp.]MCH4124974.1 rod shape-determining protein MreD [Companilactobacillus sp.]MCH4131516.1 rod shape-determining protein MreD [Companilactobacillus sp.]
MPIKTRKIIGQVVFIMLAFYLDGLIKWAFLNNMNTGDLTFVPQLMLMVLVMLTIRIDSRRMILTYGIIFGLIYDSYYFGIIGLYTILLPLILVGIDHYKFLFSKTSVGLEMSVYFLSLTALQSGVFLLEKLFRLASADVGDFITFILGPTLLWNIVVFFVLYVPFANLSDWLVKYRRGTK